jgi:hypothetical protein
MAVHKGVGHYGTPITCWGAVPAVQRGRLLFPPGVMGVQGRALLLRRLVRLSIHVGLTCWPGPPDLWAGV